MFGIGDILSWYLAMRWSIHKKFRDNSIYEQIKPATIFASKKKVIWLCFPGWGMSKTMASRMGFLPSEGTIYFFDGPMSLAGKSPEQSLESMDRLEKLIEEKLEGFEDYKIKVFGFSAGTLAAFYFANKYKAKKLVAVTPGRRMGLGIYTSIGSRICRDHLVANGFATDKDYDDKISRINQENNLENLGDTEIIVYSASGDRYIREYGTIDLVDFMKEKGLQVLHISYKLLDHTTLISWLSVLKRLGRARY